MRLWSPLLALAVTTVALAADPDGGVDAGVAVVRDARRDRAFTWTLERDDAGNGTWSLDCTLQDHPCLTDFDGGMPSPLRCPAGSHCSGSIIPVGE